MTPIRFRRGEQFREWLVTMGRKFHDNVHRIEISPELHEELWEAMKARNDMLAVPSHPYDPQETLTVRGFTLIVNGGEEGQRAAVKRYRERLPGAIPT